MSTQRLDLPRGFSKSGTNPRAPCTDLRNPSICNFRPNLVVPNPSLVLKRLHEEEDDYNLCSVRAKRTRLGDEGIQFGGGAIYGGNQGLWFPQPVEGGAQPVEGGEGEEEEEEQEQKVFFVPVSAGTGPSFPLFGSSSYAEPSLAEGTEAASSKTNSDSSSSSGTGTNGTETETERTNGTDRYGLELVSLLVDCVDAIGAGNHEVMNYSLSRLGDETSPFGPMPVQRLTAYFTEGLVLRVSKLWPHWYALNLPREAADHFDEDDGTALRLLNTVSPIPKFLHFTINARLVRAFEGKDRVHIIDFDIKQGLQWPALLESLASRPDPPSHVRITGIGESRQELQETGTRLARLAQERGLQFEFHPVVDRLEDVRLWMLHVKRDECVAVNCVFVMHRMLSTGTGTGTGAALGDFLGLVKSTNPAIVLMAEQEASHNERVWERRVAHALKYYAAIFDSLDDCLPHTSGIRVKIEEMFGREIRNVISCMGNERVERHERFETWKRLMEEGGFRNGGIGEMEMIQSRLMLRMFDSEKFAIEKKGGGEGLSIKWMDQALYTVSSWTVSEVVAGSSSTASLSQVN
ncbi:hypothetical protein LUZ60_007189 [Juncus effusus]|nr:hypothetical protein LUZ60_007189 [Juncus effusus]